MDRLFEKIAWDTCTTEERFAIMDGDTPLIDDSLHGSKDAKAVSNTKIPVRLLMLAVMHLILDDHDECLKSIFRMFKRSE